MSRKPKNGPARRSRRRLGTAAGLLLVILASLVAVLILLPPRRAPEPGSGAFAIPGRPQEPREPRPGVDPQGYPQVPGAPWEPSDPEARTPSGGPEAPSTARRPGRPAEAPPDTKRRLPDEPTDRTVPASRLERFEAEARIALVIDDVGYSLDTLQVFLDFPGPIALAVLPQLPHSRESARLIRKAGKELLLHLPMEAMNGEDPGPGAILSSHSAGEIRELLKRNLAGLEAAVGVNNHMGSRATADLRVMEVVMEHLRGSGRFFLDSRTTAATVAPAAAQAASVDFIERDVFVDNQTDPASMRAAMERGVVIARERGHAVLIGHAHNPELVGILRELLEELHPHGVRLAPLSELVRAKRDPE